MLKIYMKKLQKLQGLQLEETKMCGILGVKVTVADQQLFDNILYIYQRQQHRGNIGFGVARNRLGVTTRLRGSGQASQMFTAPQYVEFWKETQAGDSIVMHHRYATTGGNGYCKDANHPICTEDNKITMVHNGGVYDYRNLYKKLSDEGHEFETEIKTVSHHNYVLSRDITDSEVLAHLIEGGIANIKDVSGSIAIAYFRKGSPKTYLYRTTNPLIVYKDVAGNLYYSSEFHNDGRFTLVSNLRSGVFYSLSDVGLRWIRRVKDSPVSAKTIQTKLSQTKKIWNQYGIDDGITDNDEVGYWKETYKDQ